MAVENVQQHQSSINWQAADLAVWLDTEPPALDFLFDNLFPCGIVAGLGGAGGVGKSTLALELAFSLASGVTIFPAFAPVAAVPVMVFLGEDPSRMTWQRIWNMARRFQLSPEQKESLKRNLVVYSDKAAPLCTVVDGQVQATAHYAWLKQQVSAQHPALLILDPKARWSASNENSNDEATALVGLLEELVRPHGGSVLITHHVSKARKSTMDVSSARGASAFPDATRLFLSMVEVKTNDHDVEDEHEVLLHTTKSNFAPRLPKALVLRHCAEFGGVFEQAPDQDRAQIATVAASLAEWLTANGGMNVSAIRDPRTDKANELHCFMEERCGSYRKYIDAALKAGEDEGIIVIELVSTGGRKARLVSAARPDADGENTEE